MILLLTLMAVQTPTLLAPPSPRLVIALAVDQLRTDYLVRWRGEFTGGLGMLLREGVFYRNGLQDHAITETAPGHSTMMTGRSPASTNILSNDFGVGDRTAPLIGSTALGASPRRLSGTTLYDWMLARDSATRALSVSRKDRGAILPIGRARAPVFWYSQGRFTTSRYYLDSLPNWLRVWNARDPVAKLAGSAWTLSRPASAYPERDDRPFEFGGKSNVFPHLLPSDWTMASGEIEEYPVIDSLTLDVAWHGVRSMRIGQRDGVDFLAVSLSATDNVGHRYGPGSREIHDQLLKLDRWLGVFFDSLATIVPRDRMIISLTSDHGVTEYPEAGAGGRLSLAADVRALTSWFRSRWQVDLGAVTVSGLVLADTSAMSARGIDVDSIAAALAARVSARPGVRRVHTPKSLARARANDVDAMRWRRQISGRTDWLIAVSTQPGWIWSSGNTSTGHGTTNPDDVNVPIIIRAPGVTAAQVAGVARTIDIAPTLAALLRITPTQAVEGIVLPELRPRRTPR